MRRTVYVATYTNEGLKFQMVLGPARVVIEGESVKIFATIPLPNKIHEREMDKTDIPGTFNSGATLGPVNETNMARIWNKHKTNTPLKRKVFVGLSGGVDSAVSAALLKEKGYDVVGAFIKIWQPEFIECTWKEDRLDAMRVASALEVPFREVDLSEAYKKEIIDPMVEGYSRGETPNPDVMCNRHIKFGHFAAWAREQGADMVATGHYARIRERGGHVELLRGKDAAKDQSYFLHRLQQRELARAIFPIGDRTKAEVRDLARRYQLPVAERPDSQGLCFVGDISMGDFLARFIPVQPGAVLDRSGEVIGEHRGAALYTVGQRHGFSLRLSSSSPFFVVRVDTLANTITVSPDKNDAGVLMTHLCDIHWIHRAVALPLRAHAQARYRERPFATTIEREGEHIIARFDTPHVVAPGQSLVFYQKDTCLGGGIISAQAPVHSASSERKELAVQ